MLIVGRGKVENFVDKEGTPPGIPDGAGVKLHQLSEQKKGDNIILT